MALLGSFSVFLFDKIEANKTINIMYRPMNFFYFLKIISLFSIYISLIYSMYMIIKTINTKEYKNFEVKDINEKLMSEERLTGTIRIVLTYRNIIIEHRKLNEIKAKYYKNALYSTYIFFISIIIYFSIVIV